MMATHSRILLIGDYYIDQIFDGVETWMEPGREVFAAQLTTLPGGAFTHARALSRLNAPVIWAADLGDDEMSSRIRVEAEAEGMDSSWFQNHAGPRRRLSVAVTHSGDRGFVSYRDNTPRPDYADIVRRARPTHLLAAELTMGEPWRILAEACQEVGAQIILDPQHNDATLADPLLVETLSTLAVFMPNAAEAISMTGMDSVEAAAKALNAHVPLVVVKDGSAGALLCQEGTLSRVAAATVSNVVDTVGAGDCFDAGFVAGLVSGLKPIDAVQLGVVCGSLSVSGTGGSAAPTAQQIMNSHPHLITTAVGI